MSLYGHLVICTPIQVADRIDETPIVHFGRYSLLVAAEAHMRYLGQYIKHLVVWDIKTRETVAMLRQEELEYDPLAPPIELYIRVQEGITVSWKKKPYAYHKMHRDEIASEPE